MAFSTKIKGNHHLQGNVQAYNVRIPALEPPQVGTHRNASELRLRAAQVMSALERSRQWELAVELFEEMRRTSCPPDQILGCQHCFISNLLHHPGYKLQVHLLTGEKGRNLNSRSFIDRPLLASGLKFSRKGGMTPFQPEINMEGNCYCHILCPEPAGTDVGSQRRDWAKCV